MKILLISYSYFPAKSPRSYRWTAICDYLSINGYEIDIICCGNEKPPYKNNNITIHYIKDILLNVKLSKSLKKSNFLKDVLKGISKKIVQYLRWPDYSFAWIYPAIKKSKNLIEKNNYKAIISVAHPFSSHIIAFLSIKHKKINWILDYGDPFALDYFSPPNNLFLYKHFNKYIENIFIKRCNYISLTNVETIKLFQNHYGYSTLKYKLINPLLSINVTDYFTSFIRNITEPIKFIYTGTLYKKIRNPDYLLELFSLLSYKLNFELHFFGNINDCNDNFNKYIKKEWLHIHGEIDRSLLKNFYNKQTIFINISNVTEFQTPSKILEYIATGLPIINLSNDINDPLPSFLKNYKNKLFLLKNDYESNCDKIFDFINTIQPISFKNIEIILDDYKVSKISNKYIELINNGD